MINPVNSYKKYLEILLSWFRQAFLPWLKTSLQSLIVYIKSGIPPLPRLGWQVRKFPEKTSRQIIYRAQCLLVLAQNVLILAGKVLLYLLRWLAWLLHVLVGKFSPAFWLRALFYFPVFLGRQLLELLNKWRLLHRQSFRLVLPVLVSLLFFSVWYHFSNPWLKIKTRVSPPGLTNVDEGQPPEPVYVNFSEPVANLAALEQKLKEGISLDPPLRGSWQWVTDQQLQFVPEEDWLPGRQYTIEMKRQIFSTARKMRALTLDFVTPAFSGNFLSAMVYQDPRDPKIIRIVAALRFSHPVDRELLAKSAEVSLSASDSYFAGEKLPLELHYNTSGTEAYLASAPIKILAEGQKAKIEISSGLLSARGGEPLADDLQKELEVPALDAFFQIKKSEIALVTNDSYIREQVLVIETSAGIESAGLLQKISVKLLPKDRYPGGELEPEKDFAWSDPAQVSEESLKKAEALPLEALPAAEEYPTLHSFRFKAEPGRSLLVHIPAGIKSRGDFTLVKNYTALVQVPEFPREVKIALQGSILSLSGEKKLSVFSYDAEAIRYTIKKIKPSDIAHLVSQGYNYRQLQSPEFDSYGSISEENIAKTFVKTVCLGKAEPGQTQFSSLDLGEFLNDRQIRHGLFILEAEVWDRGSNSAIGEKDRRFVMLTDLGLVCKKNHDQSYDVFVQSVAAGRPVAGVKIDLIGKNGLPVRSSLTDQSGHASLPSARGLYNENEPQAFLAENGDDLSFLPVNMYNRELDFTRFDTGGDYTAAGQKNLDAFLFSDRGIYRPGETIRLGLLVKTADWRALPPMPLELVVSDPRGVEIRKETIRFSGQGLAELSHATSLSAPTGEYNFRLYLPAGNSSVLQQALAYASGGQVASNNSRQLIGSVDVQLEEFVPDKLKIASKIEPASQQGWVSPKNLRAVISLKNLYGTPASAHRIASGVRITPALPRFKGYEDYVFSDPLKAKGSFTERLPDSYTDEEGEASLLLPFDYLEKGSYRLDFTADGFEPEGGRAVRSVSSVIVSPLAYLLGYKADGDLSYLQINSKRSVSLLALSPDLKKTAVSGLTLEFYEKKMVSALLKTGAGLYSYQSVEKKSLLHSRQLSLPATGLALPLDTAQPGDFFYLVKDAEGHELASFSLTVAGRGDLQANLEKNAELQVKLNKNDYQPGEEIEIFIRAPYTGSGLITIEREKVYSYKWFKTDSNSTIERISLPGQLEGNAYVNVTFLRNADSREVFTNPLSFGVAPFMVNQSARKNQVELKVPELVRPGQKLTIAYRSQKPAKILLFAVDEGILQVARHQSPDPASHFFRKKALQVRTSQLLDLVLPEFSILKAMAQPGGGEGFLADLAGANLNPFQARERSPVVYWSGLVEADQNWRELQYSVPDSFNGSLRIMAVAAGDSNVGSAAAKTLVRGHFVISANAPVMVAAGDRFSVAVAVANQAEGSGSSPEIEISAHSDSAAIALVGEKVKKTVIAEGKQKTVIFEFEAGANPGLARISLEASLQDKKARALFSISNRPAMPYLTKTSGGYEKSADLQAGFDRELLPHFARKEVLVSRAPLALAHGLAVYLKEYPYGCTEQLVSQAMVSLLAHALPEFGFDQKSAESNLQAVLKTLAERQNAAGSFGFWSANSRADDFQTIYASHFLTELADSGYAVPYNLKARALKYLLTVAGGEFSTLAEARKISYAIYVLTRNRFLTTSQLLSLHEKLQKADFKEWKTDITAAYMAASYQLMMKYKEAGELLAPLALGEQIQSDYNHYYDSLARDAQLLFLVSRHFPESLSVISPPRFDKFLAQLNRGKVNTVSSAFSLLALQAYSSHAASEPLPGFVFGEKDKRVKADKNSLFATASAGYQARSLKVQAASPGFYYQINQSGFDRQLPAENIENGLEIYREFRNQAGEKVQSGTVGELLTVTIYARSLEQDQLANVAVVDLLSGGFEADLASVQNLRQPQGPAEEEEYADEETDSHLQSRYFLDYVDSREDRLIFFAQLGKEARKISYQVRLVAPGRYSVPPLYAESMYDRSIHALTKADVFEVKKPGL